jgi:isopenicillin-N N-acyltransferase-like protein
MNDSPTRYREVEVEGAPREMGRQIGEAVGELVRGFHAMALESVNRTVNVSPATALAVSRDSTACAEQYSAEMVEECRGVAEASGLNLEDVMLLQVRNQFVDGMDHACTALSVDGSAVAAGRSIVAQNWDNDPALDEFTIVLTRRPVGKPALMTVTQAGLISYLGFNDAGIGVCVNTLPAPSKPVGVPHYFTLRGVFETTSLNDAVDAVRRAERAIPANMMMATPEGPANLEITVDDVHVLQDRIALTHTNHCLHPELTKINADFPELIESGPRKARIDQLVLEARSPLSIEQLKQALADHQDHPRSICRHPNDDPRFGFMTSVFSIIVDVEQQQMHVTRGNPCCQPYEIYQLNK